jgi:hypothetical protein
VKVAYSDKALAKAFTRRLRNDFDRIYATGKSTANVFEAFMNQAKLQRRPRSRHDHLGWDRLATMKQAGIV